VRPIIWQITLIKFVYGVKDTSFLIQNYNYYSATSNANSMNTDYSGPTHIDTLRPRRPGPKTFHQPRTQLLCFTCGKPGHIAAICHVETPRRFRKTAQQGKGRRQQRTATLLAGWIRPEIQSLRYRQRKD
jgi:Zinc knuckle